MYVAGENFSKMVDKVRTFQYYGSNKEADVTVDRNRPIPSSCKLYIAAFSAWLGSVAMGSTIGYTSPAIPLMREESSPVRITRNEAAWIGSLMNVGALVAGPITGYVIEKFGRKTALFYITFPFIVGYLLMAYARNLTMLLIGRIVTGFCAGSISLSVPVYLGEISPPSIRGRLGTIIQMFITFGVVCTYTVGTFVPWTWLAFFCTLWPTLMLIMITMAPETPFWLARNGEKDAAIKSIQFLRGKNYDATREYVERLAVSSKLSSSKKFSFYFLKHPTVYKPLLISLAIMFLRQFSGMIAIMFYTVSIFKHAGSSVDPNLSAIIVGSTQFVGTFLATILMDKVGRRILLIVSSTGMCFSMSIFGVYYYMASVKGDSFHDVYGWLPLVTMIVYNIMFAFGFGPIPWLLIGELFPDRVRGFASGVASSFNWLCAFIVAKEFHNMLDGLSSYGTYFFFASICISGSIFVYIMLPETKGRSHAEIERMFAGNHRTVLEDVPICGVNADI
ncbi:SLC2A8 (predicted) [Pycnogonum litorale]